MNKPHKIVDSLLVLSYQSGDKKALALLVKRWHKRLCGHAFRYTRNMDEAKDVVQDSWRVILNKLFSLKDTNCFGSWAMTIVTRKALDHIKKNKRFVNGINEENNPMAPYPDAADYLSKENDLSKVMNAIAFLNEDQRMVLKLFYLEEYSIVEIGRILNVSEGTVKTRLFRAREKLKTIIKT